LKCINVVRNIDFFVFYITLQMEALSMSTRPHYSVLNRRFQSWYISGCQSSFQRRLFFYFLFFILWKLPD